MRWVCLTGAGNHSSWPPCPPFCFSLLFLLFKAGTGRGSRAPGAWRNSALRLQLLGCCSGCCCPDVCLWRLIIHTLNASVLLSLHGLLFLALSQGFNIPLLSFWAIVIGQNCEHRTPSPLGMSPFLGNCLKSLVSRST